MRETQPGASIATKPTLLQQQHYMPRSGHHEQYPSTALQQLPSVPHYNDIKNSTIPQPPYNNTYMDPVNTTTLPTNYQTKPKRYQSPYHHADLF
ncbi:hypothetical protein BC941DRAFT_411682 [Chlamydoabsidia padenii]|nr:hypothetical protein BC941DRAFT_411682 [Chlamydoabsidia padenii]